MIRWIAFAAAAVVAVALWWHAGRPQALPDGPEGKLACVSYAPYRGAQSPFDSALVIPPEQIAEDLRVLKQRVGCVRTYAVSQGLAEVPRFARENGLKVLLGIWIGRDPKDNAAEIRQGIALARAYPDVVAAVIVGNEVLLRREQSPERLVEMIREVKAAVPMPVTYADVWEFWVRNVEIAAVTDYVTVHILPYWEDEPVAIGAAVPHVRAVLDRVRAAFPGRRLYIGETGWPSAGRQREGAVPSLVNQTRYLREFSTMAAAERLEHNVIEAFDQPWKRRLEGTVGGYWGVYDGDRQPKFDMTGPVGEDPRWLLHAAIALALACCPMLALRMRRGAWPEAAGFAVGAQIAGSALVLQALRMLEAARNPLEWAVCATGLGLTAAVAWMVLAAVADGFEGWPRPAPLRAVLDGLCGPRRLANRAGLLGLLHAVAAVAGAAVVLCMVFDPRYRDFPVAAFIVPALGFLAYARWRPAEATGVEERWIAGILAVGGLIGLGREGLANGHAIAWAGVVMLLALPWLRPSRAAPRAASPAAAPPR